MANLLVVEDDEVLLRGLEALLARAGHNVRSAISGQAALDVLYISRAETNPLDLIITDVLMPGMSGLQLLEAVRSQAIWHNVPFLFITAQNASHMEEQIAMLEMASILYKPFDAERLEGAVMAALEERW